MATNSRHFSVGTDAVWAVLSDGHSYGDWVVGTSTIRDVDAGFPAPGTRIHYTVGCGPIRHEGHTEVLAAQDGHRLELEANAWPLGAAKIVLRLVPGPGDGCTVWIDEAPSRGPGHWLHNPVTDLAIKLRNVETLRRLQRLSLR